MLNPMLQGAGLLPSFYRALRQFEISQGWSIGEMDAEKTRITTCLEEFYREKHPETGDISIPWVVEMTSGWETELYGFNLEYRENGVSRSRKMVARLHSGKSGGAKAKREYTVMKGLGAVGYPVPEVYDLESTGVYLGKPFLILEWISGRTMEKDFLNTPREALGPHINTFSRLFADLHQIDCELIFHGTLYQGTQGYLESLIRRNREEVEAQGLEWLDPVLDWLEEMRGDVSEETISVLHRDFHPGNIIMRDDSSHAVIDWGASQPGDYRDDLLWTVLLGSAFWGRTFGEMLLRGYERAAGKEVRDAGFWEVTGILRRILDLAVSLTAGSEEAGMRSGGLEQMRGVTDHYHRIHGFLEGRTGLRLTEFEELLRIMERRP
ncbi:MAG: phosphotransferase [Candidatus Bathyarchaeota archaeon]|jgi:aminoglycoside phosphotransferase (APT) family kinase protein